MSGLPDAPLTYAKLTPSGDRLGQFSSPDSTVNALNDVRSGADAAGLIARSIAAPAASITAAVRASGTQDRRDAGPGPGSAGIAVVPDAGDCACSSAKARSWAD